MEAEAEVRVKLPRDLLEIALNSLLPETKVLFPRTRVKVESLNGELILEFEAKDTSALRAVLNSYLGWLKMIDEIYRSLERQKAS
ncbi:hypothetical protein CP083_03640 [Candidatus Bathyarchaeota archaeon B24-2]|nr:MAG: hypothetical protein CP083_03640 [Candidatus Bathyarchaeota archaeon B24-2]